jgi:hypothetical protein
MEKAPHGTALFIVLTGVEPPRPVYAGSQRLLTHTQV